LAVTRLSGGMARALAIDVLLRS